MTSSGLRPVIALLAALAGGCATGLSERASDCPPIADYPAELQARADADLALLPADSPLHTMIDDYGVLRDQLRACGR